MTIRRSFEACKGYENVQLPKRSTTNAAGYDFYADEDVTIPSIVSTLWGLIKGNPVKPTIVHTHVKARMRSNEVLLAFNRSSNPGRGLILANGVGVIDADYYGNPNNDGDIGFGFYNILPVAVTIKKGQRIGQGLFTTFLKTYEDTPSKNKREGGFGSTGE